MSFRLAFSFAILLVSTTVTWAAEPPASSPAQSTVNETYPNLACDGLSGAKLGKLPNNQLMRCEKVAITQKDLDAEIAKAADETRPQLEKNRFFLLEQIATKRLLLQEANSQNKSKDAATTGEEIDVIQKYLDQQVKDLNVSDEEVQMFYDQNKEMCGEAPLSQIKDQLKQFVYKQKKQDAINLFIRTLGQRTPIIVASDWTKEQAALAMQNPVDEARRSGKSSLIDFGADGCVPCDMMAPILKDLTKKYEGKMNVQFIHVREQQILAARYGIQSIPVQVIFDNNGKEVFRHTGFLAQEELEKQIAAQGVK